MSCIDFGNYLNTCKLRIRLKSYDLPHGDQPTYISIEVLLEKVSLGVPYPVQCEDSLSVTCAY